MSRLLMVCLKSVCFLLSWLSITQSQWVMYPKPNPPRQVIYYPQVVQQPYQPVVQQPYVYQTVQPIVAQPNLYQTLQPNSNNVFFPNPNSNLGNNNVFQSNQQTPIVRTSRGQLRGKVMQTDKGFRMFAYLGVPYAEPPNLFQRSEPKRPWNGILDASELGPGCTQGQSTPGSSRVRLRNGTSTDCLYLKILVPAQRNSPLPVLFWPHGGGFSGGSNRDYDISAQGDNIVSKEVIIAQPSYRTGAMGFWSSMSPDAPGNYGMWDILNALQFVKREIANFGGDPNRITLMGQGAGGISSDAMTLSPLTRGLYSKAAMLSGSMFQTNVNLRAEANENVFKSFVTAADCDDRRNSQWNSGRRSQIVQCLKSKSPQMLLQAQSDANLGGSLVWHPIVDGVGGILPLAFERLARQRPLFPVLMGSTNHETAWDLLVLQTFATKRTELPGNLNSLNSRLEVFRQCDKLVTDGTFRNPSTVRELCKIQFGNSEEQTANPYQRDQYYWLEKAIRAGSSFTYFAPIHKDLSFHLQNGNRQAYLYSFDYFRQQGDPWWQLVKSFHNLDIAYIEHFFPLDIYRFQMDNRDLYIQQVITGIITNFAKTGNPSVIIRNQTIRWEPLNIPQGFNYLSVDVPTSMKPYYHMDDIIFWNQLAPLGARNNSAPFPNNPPPPIGPGPVRPGPNQPFLPPQYTNAPFPDGSPNFPNTNQPLYPSNPNFPNTIQPFFPGNPNFLSTNQPFFPQNPNTIQPFLPGNPRNIFPPITSPPGGFSPNPNIPSNFGPGPVLPPRNQNLTINQVLNNGLEFIRNFLPPILNSIASAVDSNRRPNSNVKTGKVI